MPQAGLRLRNASQICQGVARGSDFEKRQESRWFLLIDYTTWGNIIFGTAPIEMRVRLFVITFAVGMAILEELRKWLVRKWWP
jgi:hypothetical protein